ncbi:MAG: phosphatidate cytidylyltransferase [Oscillospiraceae bacterium]|nr:phosphatidate cytidylyltransferase [Oscillospiraceae bacterium]MBQ9929929.1 phosphatidate cytidylyltransferase [Oscillospiraceae bacterium]
MKTRVLTAAIAVPVLLVILLALPKLVAAIVLGLMCALASYELLSATGFLKHIRLVIYSSVMALLVPVWSYLGSSIVWANAGILVFCAAVFTEMMLNHIKLRFDRIAVCFVAGVVIPYLFSSIVRIHIADGTGRFFVLIPLIIAFISDSGAYFVGLYLGRRKLAPAISPNKTVEGAIGGLIASVLGMLLYMFILDIAFGFKVNYLAVIVYGIVCAAAGVFGDLCFSVIKRQAGIKDYGTLIPGHGGILDRFDSMVIIAPLVEFLLAVFPVAVK